MVNTIYSLRTWKNDVENVCLHLIKVIKLCLVTVAFSGNSSHRIYIAGLLSATRLFTLVTCSLFIGGKFELIYVV